MKSLKAILIGLTVAMAVAPALAGEALPSRRGESPPSGSSELRTAARDLASRSEETKGAPRLLMKQEARRLEDLANQIDAGRRVDPAEIDRMIERAEHGQF